jgi:hypothetical protein
MGRKVLYMRSRRIPNPWHWAWPLWVYQRRQQLDDAAPAAELEMPAENLGRLRARRLTCSDEPAYRADLARVSALVGCNAFALRHLLERVKHR